MVVLTTKEFQKSIAVSGWKEQVRQIKTELYHPPQITRDSRWIRPLSETKVKSVSILQDKAKAGGKTYKKAKKNSFNRKF